ncbi:MAG TPA: hypothetical protein VGP44_04430 [Gemmatimonadales bacterium]|nr:hypothetical protein [Gemmatimonadales bacterium]
METMEPGKAGRPTKRTPAVEKRLVELIREGLTQKDASAIVGISEDSFIRWKQDFADFAARIKKAEAEFILDNVRIVQKAASANTWQASAWILERRRTEAWGRKETVVVPPEPENLPDQFDLNRLSNDKLSNLRDLLTAATVPDQER